jgi:hypothetical protein
MSILGWLAKITEGGVRRRAEIYYQQFDALAALRQESMLTHPLRSTPDLPYRRRAKATNFTCTV